MISSIRVEVEHVIAEMKQYGCFSNRYRNKTDSTHAFFKLLSAVLLNFNLSH